ncbi:beta-ketoacyl synthase N-terminal-like domain-containing protein [Streptomyces sp. NPDC095613]|uniref:beta-ketoacyl synthase N-terminal-like domain-containing protein n=1 Tax=Streptomyces sp. NPDC095613 TaxID=3155540 RepID=UPI00333227D3
MNEETSGQDTPTAVIGMAGRFPGAASVSELWRNLLNGERAVRRFTDEELREAGVPDDLARHPSYVPMAAALEDIDLFDAEFFGIPSREAQLTDPQHRLFLETCWAALEDAGHPPGRFDGRIGVFGSSSLSTYLLGLIAAGEELPPDGISYPLLLGNDKDFLCTRTAHRLGLTGPAVTVQTACSSSLVAVHLATQALLAGECDMALAGGVSVTVPQKAGYLYREGGILSPDGRCRVFDAGANGTVRGSGCGVVVLRRLDDAVADRDRVSAVIRGSAVNNDGADKVGFTAPGAAGQVEVIREAIAVSGLPADAIGYVEAHGTGTSLGDPIEVRALASAHAADGEPPKECHLGSVKANLGHLDAAAGVTGLIKTVLVLREQVIPGQPDFTAPGPAIEAHLAGYRVSAEPVRPAAPLRAAAVSSFGLGGTNAHVVLAAPPPVGERPAPAGSRLALLSARDTDALATLAGELRDHLRVRPDACLDDIVFTLAHGRTDFAARAALRCRSVAELVDLLGELASGGTPPTDPAAADWLAGGPRDPRSAGDCPHARRVALPGHPMRRRRHWIDARQAQRSGPPAQPSVSEPDLAERVREVITRMLDAPELGPDDDFYDQGLDSMRAVETVTLLRDTTGLPLSFEEFDGLRTLSAVVAHMAGLAGPASDAGSPVPPASAPVSSASAAVSTATTRTAGAAGFRHLLSRIREGSAPGHVFMVPPAGGTVVAYIDLSRHMRDERTLWALTHPSGQPGRHRSVRDLARLYTSLVREVQPQGPYLLAGYSFGGSVALEMAAELERDGEEVERTVLLDSHPPEAYIGGSADDAAFLAAFPALVGKILPGSAPGTGEAAAEAVETVPPRSVEEVIERLADGTWSAAMKAELAGFFHTWQDNHEALKRWFPDRPLSGDIVVLAAEQEEDRAIMRALDIRRTERGLWARHSSGRVEVRQVPGDHYSMIRSPEHLPHLGAAFDRALGPAGTP